MLSRRRRPRVGYRLAAASVSGSPSGVPSSVGAAVAVMGPRRPARDGRSKAGRRRGQAAGCKPAQNGALRRAGRRATPRGAQRRKNARGDAGLFGFGPFPALPLPASPSALPRFRPGALLKMRSCSRSSSVSSSPRPFPPLPMTLRSPRPSFSTTHGTCGG